MTAGNDSLRMRVKPTPESESGRRRIGRAKRTLIQADQASRLMGVRKPSESRRFRSQAVSRLRRHRHPLPKRSIHPWVCSSAVRAGAPRAPRIPAPSSRLPGTRSHRQRKFQHPRPRCGRAAYNVSIAPIISITRETAGSSHVPKPAFGAADWRARKAGGPKQRTLDSLKWQRALRSAHRRWRAGTPAPDVASLIRLVGGQPSSRAASS
jgi:hypothetical protein